MSLKDFMDKERRAIEEAWLKGNVDALNETIAPDIVVHNVPFPDIKGLEAFKQSILALRQAFTILRWDFEESIGEGNTIANRHIMRMKHTGTSPWITLPPTGKEVFLKGCVVLHVNNGKIVEMFVYDDNLGLFQQLGVVPPRGQK